MKPQRKQSYCKNAKRNNEKKEKYPGFPLFQSLASVISKMTQKQTRALGTIVSCSMKQRDEKSQLTFNPPSRNLSNYPFNMHKCITAHSSITENLQD